MAARRSSIDVVSTRLWASRCSSLPYAEKTVRKAAWLVPRPPTAIGRPATKPTIRMPTTISAAGAGVSEIAGNYANVDPDNAERSWCIYAWPMRYGVSGRRAFFMNQQGQIMQTDNATQEYSGMGNVPPADAAFDVTGAGTMVGELAAGVAGNDGGIWRSAN